MKQPAQTRLPPASATKSRAWYFSPAPKTRFTDAAGAADFLREGGCRFAFVEARQERAFALRAEAIGLRYARGPRIDGYQHQYRQADDDCGL